MYFKLYYGSAEFRGIHRHDLLQLTKEQKEFFRLRYDKLSDQEKIDYDHHLKQRLYEQGSINTAIRKGRSKGLANFIFPLILLLVVASCNSPSKNGDQSPQDIVATDSPTGDALLDSLLRLAVTARPDTNLVKLYEQIGDIYLDNDFLKAREYYLKLNALSEKLNWNEGRYQFAASYTDILNMEGLIDCHIWHQKCMI